MYGTNEINESLSEFNRHGQVLSKNVQIHFRFVLIVYDVQPRFECRITS